MADAPAVAKRERGPSFEVSIDAEDDVAVSVHDDKLEREEKGDADEEEDEANDEEEEQSSSYESS